MNDEIIIGLEKIGDFVRGEVCREQNHKDVNSWLVGFFEIRRRGNSGFD